MSTLLKDVLVGVLDDAELPEVDQGRALEAGRSRLKRRRRGIGAGISAGALVAAVAVPVGISTISSDGDALNPTDSTQVEGDGAFAERKVTYSQGSDIHYGDDTIAVAPHKIKAFVQTDKGFAFIGDGDTVFFTDGESVRELGTADAPYGQLLTSDDAGALVAWVDLSSEGEATYYVYNAVSGQTESVSKRHTADGEFELPSISAVDGSHVYAWSDEGEFVWNLDTGNVEVIKQGVDNGWLLDAQDGWMAFDDSDPDNAKSGNDAVIAKSVTSDSPRYPSGRVALSPDATYFANDHDDTEQIIDRVSGEIVTPDHEGYAFIALMQWTDDDKFTAVGFTSSEEDKLDLLDCSVAAGSCETKVSGIDHGKGLALPIGSSSE